MTGDESGARRHRSARAASTITHLRMPDRQTAPDVTATSLAQPPPVAAAPARSVPRPTELLGPLVAIWRGRWLVLTVAVVCGALAYGISTLLPPVYVAEARLRFVDPIGEIADRPVDSVDRSLRTEAQRMTARDALRMVRERAEDPADVEALARAITVSAAPDADVVTVTATGASARQAVARVEAVVTVYREQVAEADAERTSAEGADLLARAERLTERIDRQQRRLDDALTDLADQADGTDDVTTDDRGTVALRLALEGSVNQLNEVQQRRDTLVTRSADTAAAVEVLESARAPEFPESPRPRRNALTAALLALLAVGTWLWWCAEPEVAAVRDGATAQRLLDAPMLARIPATRTDGVGIVGRERPDVVDAYRLVATELHAGREGTARSLAITAVDGDARRAARVALNIASAHQRDGRAAMLVDGDPRQRPLSTAPAMAARDGFADVVDGRTPLGDAVVVGDHNLGGWLGLIPWGQATMSATGLDTRELASTVRAISDHVTLTLVVAPSPVTSADGVAMVRQTDGVVVVVAVGTPVTAVAQLRTTLELVGREVVGIVLDGVPVSRQQSRRKTSLRTVRWQPPDAVAAPAEAQGTA